jgi:hypothetical protein
MRKAHELLLHEENGCKGFESRYELSPIIGVADTVTAIRWKNSEGRGASTDVT